MAETIVRKARRWLFPRSMGVRVSRPVARAIAAGNAARARNDWYAALGCYAAALGRDPSLAHIWIQLGHARKETGDLIGARDDYGRAAALAPHDAEPRIHLGLASKLLGEREAAASHYLAALERRPGDLALAIEVVRAAPDPERGGRDIFDRAALAFGLGDWRGAGQERAAVTALCFDVTDLLEFFGHSRLPTGIQRVQIEVIATMAADDPGNLTICCYLPARMGWAGLPIDRFRALARLSLAGDDRTDRAWQDAVVSAHLLLAGAPLVAFVDGTTLINLGASWSDQNYFLHLRHARRTAAIAYVPMVHDLIPIILPDRPPAALVRDFRNWIGAVLEMADGFLANSRSTRSDLLAVAGAEGRPVAAEAVRAVPLDGDFRRTTRAPLQDDALDELMLVSGGYVLLVSTIEPRKNHVGAFAAWRALARQLGPTSVPTLACVGRFGWRCEPVRAMLDDDPWLRDKVRLLPGRSDAELDLLYRHALFTLYPSFYEGWGLPVTESLCYGKVPAVSRVASLPEAGGPFAVYFDPSDPAAIAAAIAPLIIDPALRERAEGAIKAGFRPRSWSTIAEQIVSDARTFAGRMPSPRPLCVIEPGRRYSLAVEPPEGQARGERFRDGLGWGLPGPDGNPLDAEACLRWQLPEGAGWTMKLELLAEQDSAYRTAHGEARCAGSIAGGERRIVELALGEGGRPCEVVIDGSGRLTVAGFTVLCQERS